MDEFVEVISKLKEEQLIKIVGNGSDLIKTYTQKVFEESAKYFVGLLSDTAVSGSLQSMVGHVKIVAFKTIRETLLEEINGDHKKLYELIEANYEGVKSVISDELANKEVTRVIALKKINRHVMKKGADQFLSNCKLNDLKDHCKDLGLSKIPKTKLNIIDRIVNHYFPDPDVVNSPNKIKDEKPRRRKSLSKSDSINNDSQTETPPKTPEKPSTTRPIETTPEQVLPVKKARKSTDSIETNGNNSNEIREFPKRRRWTKEERESIFNITGGKCYLCSRSLDPFWWIDHVIAFSKDPKLDIMGNLLPTHPHCNVRKGIRNLLTVVDDKNFKILTTVLTSSLHDEVIEIIQKSKEKMNLKNDEVGCQVLRFEVLQKNEIFEGVLKETDNSFDKFDRDLLINLQNCKARELSSREFQIPKELFKKGGFGEIYKAQWHHKTVAIKNSIGEGEKQIMNEVQLLSVLQHPSLVSFYGYFTLNNRVHMVLEFVEYDLQKIFQDISDKREITINIDPLNVALDIASGIKFLHSYNLMHRDISASNILINSSGEAKIADFGLCKDDKTEPNTVINKYGYTDPTASTGVYDLRVDVFSFGMVLYYMDQHNLKIKDASRLIEDCCRLFPTEKRIYIEEVLDRLLKLKQ